MKDKTTDKNKIVLALFNFVFELIKNWVEHIVIEKKNVIGIGVGFKNDTKKLCISVLVEKKGDVPKEDKIPSRILGIPTDVVEVGCVDFQVTSALPPTPDRRSHRPIQGGIEITTNGLSVGTLGLIVPAWKNERGRFVVGDTLAIAKGIVSGEGLTLKDLGYTQWFLGITNTHVVDDNAGIPAFGKRVRHPARTGVNIGNVFTGFDIRTGKVRNKDFAMIDLTMNKNWIKPLHIEHVGTVKQEVVQPRVGDVVHTKGRTSGYWETQVTQTNVTMMIRYRYKNEDVLVRFTDCVITRKGITGGNSGSVFVTKDNKIHSLVFAGSPFIGVSHELTWLPKYLGWDLK